MTKNHLLFLAAAAFALASSCSGCFGCVPPGLDDGGNVPPNCVSGALPPEPQKLDVLFVIDNSGSMKEEQEGVARELTSFIDELKKGGGVAQDFHIGVITTSVYQHLLSGGVDYVSLYPTQEGRLQAVPDEAPDGGILFGTGTERMLLGDDPRLASKFARLVQQGTFGSGQETPFEAIRRAIIDLDKIPLASGGNGGFLRDGARLLIVILTDEDDCSEKDLPNKCNPPQDIPCSRVTVGEKSYIDYCTEQTTSLTPVSEYHRIFTEQLKDMNGDTREVIWTAIAPVARSSKAALGVFEPIGDGGQWRNEDCPTSNEPGYRHRQMAEAFDTALLNLDSICRADYKQTLLDIAGQANITQILEIRNVPDIQMLKIGLVRSDGGIDICTVANGGLLNKYEQSKVTFTASCKRRSDDLAIEIKMLCVN